MTETAKIVAMPGAKAPPCQKSDDTFAKELRAIHKKAKRLIEDARAAGLVVNFELKTNGDRGTFVYGGTPVVIREHR